MQLLARRAEEALGADGVTVLQSSGAAAWQSVFHLHFHVMPRYDGDGIHAPLRPAGGRPRRDRRGRSSSPGRARYQLVR